MAVNISPNMQIQRAYPSSNQVYIPQPVRPRPRSAAAPSHGPHGPSGILVCSSRKPSRFGKFSTSANDFAVCSWSSAIFVSPIYRYVVGDAATGRIDR